MALVGDGDAQPIYTDPRCDWSHDFEVRRGNRYRGVIALADIEEGELLCCVPFCHVLGPVPPLETDASVHEAPKDASARPTRSSVRAFLHEHKISGNMATALELLAEAARAEASPLATYIASLPESAHFAGAVPLYFSSADTAELKGTLLEAVLELPAPLEGSSPATLDAINVVDLCSDAYFSDVSEEEEDCMAVLAQRAKEVTPERFQVQAEPALRLQPDWWPAPAFANFEAYCWAATVVTTRAFSFGSHGPFLVPVADNLNHSTFSPHTRLQIDFDARNFFMRAERRICPGEEVMTSYGELSSAHLLQAFGFVDCLGNPYDMAHVANSDLLQAAAVVASERDAGALPKRRRAGSTLQQTSFSELSQRLEYLQQRGVVSACGVLICQHEALPDRLLTAALVVALLTNDAFSTYQASGHGVLTIRSDASELTPASLEEVTIEELDGLQMMLLPPEAYRDVLSVVMVATETALHRYPQSLQSDEELLVNLENDEGQPNTHSFLGILRLRVSEQRILQSVHAAANARLGGGHGT